jgi:uncharacterized protein
VKCPTCRKAVEKAANAYYPFCRERCQMADLGKWLTEEYRVPVDEPDEKGVERPAGSGDE